MAIPNKPNVPVAGTAGGRKIKPQTTVINQVALTQDQLNSIVAYLAARQKATNPSGASPTFWNLIQEIPANIVDIAALTANGFLTRNPDGSWTLVPTPAVRGEQGEPGEPGEPGPPGKDGIQGPAGFGAQGPAGPPGADGQDGVDGPPGPPGPQGFTGLTGAQGPQGPAGADGEDGNQGDPGPPGAQGIQGPAGFVGPQGPVGIPGDEGPVGEQGPPGPQGIPGTAGSTLVFAQTVVQAGDTIANNAALTPFATKYTVPPNICTTGTVVTVQAFGVLSTAGLGPTIQVQVKYGSTVILDTGTISVLVGSSTNVGWNILGRLTFQSVGGSGKLECQGSARFQTGTASTAVVSLDNIAPFTINTTIPEDITIVVDWGTASASNTITMREFLVWMDNITAGALPLGTTVNNNYPIVIQADDDGRNDWPQLPPHDPGAPNIWSGKQFFGGSITGPDITRSGVYAGMQSALGMITFVNAAAGTDQKLTRIYADTGVLHWDFVSDAYIAATDFMTIARSGTTPGAWTVNCSSGGFGAANQNSLTLGVNIPTFQFNGGNTTRTGGIRFRSSDASVDGGIYMDSAGGGFTIGAISNHPITFTVNNVARITIPTANGIAFAGQTTSTSATTGAATALPANPAGYWTVTINGSAQKIPYYN